jgi:hypothetical protein
MSGTRVIFLAMLDTPQRRQQMRSRSNQPLKTLSRIRQTFGPGVSPERGGVSPERVGVSTLAVIEAAAQQMRVSELVVQSIAKNLALRRQKVYAAGRLATKIEILRRLFIGLVVLVVSGITFTIGWRPFIGPRARALTARTYERTPARLARGEYLVLYVTLRPYGTTWTTASHRRIARYAARTMAVETGIETGYRLHLLKESA